MTSTTTYAALRLTHDSATDFERTRTRFDERVPLFDPSVSVELVVGGAT